MSRPAGSDLVLLLYKEVQWSLNSLQPIDAAVAPV